MAFDKEKICDGCQDAVGGCHLDCLKLKTKEVKAPRSILEILQDSAEIFEKYEITKGELFRTKEMEKKLKNQEITISVIGQFKRGKSTLVNTILEDRILPVGIVPVTAVVTTIVHGPKAATVHFNNGIIRPISFDEMSSYVNEQENYDNHLQVSQMELYCESPFLKNGLTLVDTPGVGSVHQKNSDAAYSYVKESDGVIFVISVDSPMNQIEMDFLKNAKEYASKFYFVVNKIDTIDEDDLKQYLDYCKALICRLMEVSEVNLFPVSAKKGIGVEELKHVITTDCKTTVKDIMEASARLKMKDIVANALSQIELYRTALNMSIKDFDEKFSELGAFLEEIKTQAIRFSMGFKNNPRMLEAQMNEVKNQLTDKVSSMFGIEYHYQIRAIDFYRGGEILEDGTRDLSEDFKKAVDLVCEDLTQTLNTIFMHREENAYVVCRRINDLNRLVRKLVSLRTELSK